jgi:transaldolase
MKTIESLKVKIFADGADKDSMIDMYKKPYIKGLTTNPTLMNKAGIRDYKSFCIDMLSSIKDKPISFEVFSDDFSEMKRQAYEIASWGDNVYVKIPITNTKSESCREIVKELSDNGIKLNITAIMTINQLQSIVEISNSNIPCYFSIFAGRIADTGLDPIPIMEEAVKVLKVLPKSELIWASPRELLNIFHADQVGCHIITVTSDILNKLKMIGYDLDKYSLDTVKMFYNDAVVAGFKI